MSKKKKFAYRAILFSLITASAASNSNEVSELSVIEKPFKVAVVKDAPGSDAIASGRLDVGAVELNAALPEQSRHYEKSMGLCALHIKTREYLTAKTACSEAISAISGLNEKNRTSQYLSAMAYSNRAIVRYFLDDTLGAFTDINKALELSDDEIVMDNLTRLNVAHLRSQVTP